MKKHPSVELLKAVGKFHVSAAAHVLSCNMSNLLRRIEGPLQFPLPMPALVNTAALDIWQRDESPNPKQAGFFKDGLAIATAFAENREIER